MKLSQTSMLLIEQTIRKAIEPFTCGCEQTIVTDIHLQAIVNSGELTLFDDDDKELAAAVIEEWMTYEGDDFYKQAERPLSNVLHTLKQRGELDKLTILQPYSFVLVDDEKETVAELLLMDEDTVLLNGELLKGLDSELDSFLKELLEK
jgi:hypothetical protein